MFSITSFYSPHLIKVFVEEALGCNKRGLLTSQHALFYLMYLLSNQRVVIEVQAQVFVDALIHPIFRLFIATIIEIAVLLDEIEVLINHIPYLLNASTVETTIAQHLGQPATIRHREEVQGVTEISSSHLTSVHIVTVALVDDDTVGDFHNATLDALQLVTSSSKLDKQEEVDHRMTGRFALTNTYCFYEYLVEASSFAKDNGFTRLTSHAAQ